MFAHPFADFFQPRQLHFQPLELLARVFKLRGSLRGAFTPIVQINLRAAVGFGVVGLFQLRLLSDHFDKGFFGNFDFSFGCA